MICPDVPPSVYEGGPCPLAASLPKLVQEKVTLAPDEGVSRVRSIIVPSHGNSLQNVSPLLVTYPTWKELFGSHPTELELLEQIRPLDVVNTVWLLARINTLVALDRFHSDEQRTIELQTLLVNLFIDDDLFERLKAKMGTERLFNRRLFHPLQILTLMKKIVVNGAKVGGLRPDMDKSAAHRLGRCLTMVNDFLFTPENLRLVGPSRTSKKLRKVALQLQVGSGLEVNNPPAIHASIVRSDKIFGDILRRTPGASDIRTVFRQQSGMEIEDYVDHVFGLLIYFITLDFHKLIEDPGLACINLSTFFAQGSPEIVQRFWNLELTTVAALETELRQPSVLKEYHDFTAFRKRPVVEVVANNATPVHVGFIQEKLESGLFWAIFNTLPTREERAVLFTKWGYLFEQYVSDTLSECLAGGAKFLPFPRFADNGDEAFDGLYTDGEVWVVMEYKGGFLNLNAKYSEDEQEFLRDLNRKFGRDRGAGIEQLVRKISAVFAAKPKERRPLTGIDPSGVHVIIPVLVVQDPFVSSEATTPYLVDVFGTMKRKQHLDRKIVCTTPLVLGVSDIEALAPYLVSRRVSFVDCLMERSRLGGARFLSFRDFFRGYLHDRDIAIARDEAVFERFRQIVDRVSRRFFNHPFEPSDNQ